MKFLVSTFLLSLSEPRNGGILLALINMLGLFRTMCRRSPLESPNSAFRRGLTRREGCMETKQMIDDHTANSATWNDRLENIAWGLFLIVVGIAWLGPGADVPLGICLTGGGLIMLALNAVRYFTGIKTS